MSQNSESTLNLLPELTNIVMSYLPPVTPEDLSVLFHLDKTGNFLPYVLGTKDFKRIDEITHLIFTPETSEIEAIKKLSKALELKYYPVVRDLFYKGVSSWLKLNRILNLAKQEKDYDLILDFPEPINPHIYWNTDSPDTREVLSKVYSELDDGEFFSLLSSFLRGYSYRDLNKMTRYELQSLAREKGIPNFMRMKKEDLINELIGITNLDGLKNLLSFVPPGDDRWSVIIPLLKRKGLTNLAEKYESEMTK